MKMPRSVKIGNYRLPIKRPRDIWPEAAGKAGTCTASPPRKRTVIGLFETDGYVGEHRYGSLISVRSDLKGVLAREVLAHEVGHAIYSYVALPEVLPEKYEEQIISAWTSTWLGVLRENPKLVEYLMGEDES